jgi:hypothetical protein
MKLFDRSQVVQAVWLVHTRHPGRVVVHRTQVLVTDSA